MAAIDHLGISLLRNSEIAYGSVDDDVQYMMIDRKVLAVIQPIFGDRVIDMAVNKSHILQYFQITAYGRTRQVHGDHDVAQRHFTSGVEQFQELYAVGIGNRFKNPQFDIQLYPLYL